MNLGAPLISAPELATPTSLWSIDMKWHDGSVFTAVYTAEQAKEIARRIIDFYGDTCPSSAPMLAQNAITGSRSR